MFFKTFLNLQGKFNKTVIFCIKKKQHFTHKQLDSEGIVFPAEGACVR